MSSMYAFEFALDCNDALSIHDVIVRWLDDYLKDRIEERDMREQAGLLLDFLVKTKEHECSCRCGDDYECECDVRDVEHSIRQLSGKVDALSLQLLKKGIE